MSWITMRDSLDLDPDVIQIAAELKMDELSVIGRLWKLWTWADQHSLTGNAMRVTEAFLDRITTCHGFATAMRNVGWLEGEDFALNFPNFERHNGQTAKARALTNRRTSRYRYAKSITRASHERDNSDAAVTSERTPQYSTEEERRVCNGEPLQTKEKEKRAPSSDVEIVQYAEAKLDLSKIAFERFGLKIGIWGQTPNHDFWLKRVLETPVTRSQWEDFLWLYSLADDDPIICGPGHVTWRKQSFDGVLEFLLVEIHKGIGARKKYEAGLGDIDAIPE